MRPPADRPNALDDPERLAAIHEAGLLDLASDPTFDRLTALATRVLDVPVALVSLVEAAEQHFLGCSTTSEPWRSLSGSPLSHSFCRHAVETGKPLVVDDARAHPDLSGNPAIEEFGVVAYAGIPLVTSESHVVGTICAIDHQPRQWTGEDVDLLEELGGLALARLELRAEVRRRRRTEEELGAQADQYRAMVENMDEIITVVGEGGVILYESSSVERILGHAPDALVGRDMMELVHPDDRASVRRALGELQGSPGASRIGEVRFEDADGGWRKLEYIAKNLLHVPAVAGIVVNSRDVSEQRALEEAVRQADKLDALGRLAGGVAHDFNNILSVIRSNADLVLLELDEDEAARPDVQEIVASVERGARLTRQLLGFSRSKSTVPELLDPAEVVEEMNPLLQRLLVGDVKLHIRVDAEVPPIRISRAELEQVLLNLTVNAGDAIEGEGDVTVELRGPAPLPENTIPVEQQEHDRYVVLTVGDTGMGIPEERRDRIFEPFYTTKGEGKGTGLGLSTVYGIAVRNGGRIRLETAVGEGSTFSVYFPAVEAKDGSGPTEDGAWSRR